MGLQAVHAERGEHTRTPPVMHPLTHLHTHTHTHTHYLPLRDNRRSSEDSSVSRTERLQACADVAPPTQPLSSPLSSLSVPDRSYQSAKSQIDQLRQPTQRIHIDPAFKTDLHLTSMIERAHKPRQSTALEQLLMMTTSQGHRRLSHHGSCSLSPKTSKSGAGK